MAALGPRALVQFGKTGKDGKVQYSKMLKQTAEYFGFKVEKKIPTRKGKRGQTVPIPGSQGSKFIAIPTGKKTKKGGNQYKQIPVPAGANLTQIGVFLKKATKNKPDTFVSHDGRTWPVG